MLIVEEREAVWADLSGNGDISRHAVQPEDSQMVSSKLEEFEVELSKVSNKASYDRALKLSSDYSKNCRFRVKFLRADRFDVKAAVHRMVRHYEEKEALFGQEKLGRDIFLADLSDNDMETLQTGGTQFLSLLDGAQRLVLLVRH